MVAKRISTRQTFRLLWNSQKPNRKYQIFGFLILALIAGFSEALNLGALLPFLNFLIDPVDNLKNISILSFININFGEKNIAFLLSLIFILAVSISTLLRIITIKYQFKLSALICSDIADIVMTSVINRPYEWFIKQNTSSIISNTTLDIDRTYIVIVGIMQFFINSFIIAILSIYLWIASPLYFTIISICLTTAYYFTFKYNRRNLSSEGYQVTDNYEKSVKLSQEILGSIREVSIYKCENYFMDKYNKYYNNYRQFSSSINTKAQTPRFVVEGLTIILIVIIALSLTFRGITIESQLPILGIIILGCYRMLLPLQQLFLGYNNIHAYDTSVQRIKPFLNDQFYKKESQKIDNKIIFEGNQTSIELKAVNYRYEEELPNVIQNINLTINDSECIGIAGETGSGKSTIIDIIMGLIKPSEGKLLVNGIDINSSKYLLESWQKELSFVSQSIYLLDGTFIDNIAFGIKEELIDFKRVKKAAEIAQISDLIESTPQKFHTFIGERGIRLSGGQIQRLGIARAIYRKSKFLIFDEATSALDTNTEELVINAISNLSYNPVIIMIAHRINTLNNCNRIVLIEKGKITKIGNYSEIFQS